MCMSIMPPPKKKSSCRGEVSCGKKGQNFQQCFCWPPRREGWINLDFLQRLTGLFDMTPTLAKEKKKNRSKAVALRATRFFFCAHSVQFWIGVWPHVLQWMRTLQADDFCVSRVPPLRPPQFCGSHLHPLCVCCIDPPRHQLGAFSVCILQCPLRAESASAQFAGLHARKGHSESLSSLTLRMLLLLCCECNL